MKKIFPFFLIAILSACGSNTSTPSTMDSVETNTLRQDTDTHARPDGYAPPQADTTNLTDSGKGAKDSTKEH